MLEYLEMPFRLFGVISGIGLTFLFLRKRFAWKYATKLDPIVNYIQRSLFHSRFPDDGFSSFTPDNEFDFYNHFAMHLSNAKDVIYNAGDGFNMTYQPTEEEIRELEKEGNRSSREKADVMDGAIAYAMDKNKNLECHRFQILEACNISYVSRLIYLKRQYPAQFFVHINRNYEHIGCFCAIDPSSSECVFEWQLVSGRHYAKGIRSKGYGFTFGNKKICKVVGSIFHDLMRRAATTNTLKDGTKFPEMDVDALITLQKELWDERINKYLDQEDAAYRVSDQEIIDATENRNLTSGRKNREFRVSDFPELPVSPDDTYLNLHER